MGLLSWFGKKVSPKRQIAAIVDAVIDRVDEKYRLDAEVKFTEGGIKIYARIVDVVPRVAKENIDILAKSDE